MFKENINSNSYDRSYLIDQIQVTVDINDSMNNGMKQIDHDISRFVSNFSHTINSNENRIRFVIKLISIPLY